MIVKHVFTIRNLLLTVLLLYVLLVSFGLFHHEPWRDEAHAWLSAQDDSIGQMIDNAQYDPVPLLWRVILMPFATSGFPYITMSLIHIGLAIVAVFLLVFFSKIPVFLKILIVFSYYMAYEYAIVARNYVLTTLILFVIAYFYKKRMAYVLPYAVSVALLFQTNAYSVVPAALLTFMYLVDIISERKITSGRVIAVCILLVTALFTFKMIIPNSQYGFNAPPQDPLVTIPTILRDVFAPSFYKLSAYFIQSFPVTTTIIGITITAFLAFFVLIWKRKDILLLTIGIYLWLAFANIVMFAGTVRHHGLFSVYFIFLLWIYESYTINLSLYERIAKRILYACLSSLFFYSVIYTGYIYYQDFTYNFSGANDMAQFVSNHALQKNPMVLFSAADGEALLPYFSGKLFWYPQLKKFARYHINDNRNTLLPNMTTAHVVSSIHTSFPNKRALVISSSPLEGAKGYILLHQSPTKHFWENGTEEYWLYEYNQIYE